MKLNAFVKCFIIVLYFRLPKCEAKEIFIETAFRFRHHTLTFSLFKNSKNITTYFLHVK